MRYAAHSERGGAMEWMQETEPEMDVTRTVKVVELSINMPCLNEAETLGICIRKAQQFLRQEGIDTEPLLKS